MLQPTSSLKIGQELQSIRYKAHESLSARVTIRRTKEPCKNRSLSLHGIVKPTRQAQLPLHQSQRLQSLPRHYPMLLTVSVATQRGHWEL